MNSILVKLTKVTVNRRNIFLTGLFIVVLITLKDIFSASYNNFQIFFVVLKLFSLHVLFVQCLRWAIMLAILINVVLILLVLVAYMNCVIDACSFLDFLHVA